MEDLFVDIPEGRIHFTKEGRGRPIVLLHSLGTSWRAYAAVIPKLADRFTVYALDLPGHGDSARPPREYSIADYAAAVVEFASTLRLPAFGLVGNSIGATIALDLASRYPERLDRLVLVGCPGWSTEEERKERLQLFRQQLDERGLPKPRTLEELALTYEKPSPELLDIVNADRAKAGVWIPKAFYALAAYNTVASLPGVRCPTFLVYGRKDLLMEKVGLLLLGIEGSQLRVIDAAGHLPQVDRPDAFAEVVISFLV